MSQKKKRRKINKVNLWAMIVSIVAVLAMIVLIIGIVIILTMLRNKPTLNLSDFDQTESSIIYDSSGDEIASLGTVIRQNIEYDELPNNVIDAFVAIEDSRFFQHNGFDIPRFTKAMIENIMSMSFGQGGSTFTMQLVKNTYFVDDETGQQAARSGARGIRRKVQEIALAMELEKYKTKQDIFSSYVNKLNFGGSNNIRGIQKAAQYYFGKDITQCNLVEGALLAGVINAPNYYNPFYNLEEAQERTIEVLYQMKNHGYITSQEYELAKTVKIENLLNDPYSSKKEGEGIPYQAYIDTVVAEVMNITGLDPYSTTMHIYTYMNKGIQQKMDDIQAGNTDDYLVYPDDYFECASVCIKNSTGEVVGVLGGRNYAGGGQLLLNHATDQYKQPGSSIKPILDYALAFENLGWATDHVLTDRPMWLDSSNQILVYNDSGTFVGDVTLSQALGQSINTCAIQTLQTVLDNKKYEYVVNYAQSLGYDFNLEDFNVQYAVGGSTCEVSPYQHAGAYAALMNYGLYNTPHTVERIEFTNGKSPITPVYNTTQVISEAAAYLTTELMRNNVENYSGTYDYLKSENYTVYAKTGTTDYGTTAREYDIPSGAVKDCWLVAATSEYTTATWVGYEKAVKGQPSYITNDVYYEVRPQGRIAHMILDAAYEFGGGTPHKLERPSGVTSITHVIGTWPYAAWTDDMDGSLRSTGLIKAEDAKLVQLATPTIKDITSNCKVELDPNSSSLTLEWPEYPDDTLLQEAEDVKDISLKNSSGEIIVPASGVCLFDYTKLYGPLRYIADITISGSTNTKEKVISEDNRHSLFLDFDPGDKVRVEMYYGFEQGDFTSNKVAFEQNAQLSFTVPSMNSSQSEVESWADKYYFINFKTETTSDKGKIDTFRVVDSNGVTLSPKDVVTVTDPNIRYTVTYYVEKDHTLSIKDTSSGENITLVAVFDNASTFKEWDYNSYPGLSFSENGKELKISVQEKDNVEDGSFTVTARTDNKRADVTVYVDKNDNDNSVSFVVVED